MGVTYNTAGIVTDGLVLALDAANPKSYPGSGTTWTDLSGNGNNGTLVNGVGYSASNFGSLVFDGVDDSSDFGNILQLGTKSRTYSIWYKSDTSTFSNLTCMLSKTDNGSTQYRQALCFETNGNFRVILRAQSNANYELVITNPKKDTNWHYLVWVLDRTSTQSIYQDGDFLLSGSISDVNNQDFLLNRPFRIGSYNSTANAPVLFFPGLISTVTVHDKALTPQEIQQNFNSSRHRYGL